MTYLGKSVLLQKGYEIRPNTLIIANVEEGGDEWAFLVDNVEEVALADVEERRGANLSTSQDAA